MSATDSPSPSPISSTERIITPVNVTFKDQPDFPSKPPVIFKIAHPVAEDPDGQQCIEGTHLIDGLFRGLDLAESHSEYDVCLMLLPDQTTRLLLHSTFGAWEGTIKSKGLLIPVGEKMEIVFTCYR